MKNERSPMRDKVFLCGIGAQKAGTSWLADYLDGHEEVFMSPIKELHYFDKLLLPKFCGYQDRKAVGQVVEQLEKLKGNRTLGRGELVALENVLERALITSDRRYKLFFHKRVRHERVFSEITPEYGMLDSDGFARIQSLFPNTKFVFLMRSPLDRVWSAIRYSLKQHGLPVAIGTKQFEERLQRAFNPATAFYQMTDYEGTIRRLEEAVPSENIFYGFYETLFSPEGPILVNKLTDFLGVTFREPDLGKNVNSTVRVSIPDDVRQRIVKTYLPVYKYVRDRFPEVPKQWLADMETGCD